MAKCIYFWKEVHVLAIYTQNGMGNAGRRDLYKVAGLQVEFYDVNVKWDGLRGLAMSYETCAKTDV